MVWPAREAMKTATNPGNARSKNVSATNAAPRRFTARMVGPSALLGERPTTCNNVLTDRVRRGTGQGPYGCPGGHVAHLSADIVALRSQRRHAPLDECGIEITDEEAMNVSEPASDRHRQAARPDHHGERLPGRTLVPAIVTPTPPRRRLSSRERHRFGRGRFKARRTVADWPRPEPVAYKGPIPAPDGARYCLPLQENVPDEQDWSVTGLGVKDAVRRRGHAPAALLLRMMDPGPFLVRSCRLGQEDGRTPLLESSVMSGQIRRKTKVTSSERAAACSSLPVLMAVRIIAAPQARLGRVISTR